MISINIKSIIITSSLSLCFWVLEAGSFYIPRSSPQLCWKWYPGTHFQPPVTGGEKYINLPHISHSFFLLRDFVSCWLSTLLNCCSIVITSFSRSVEIRQQPLIALIHRTQTPSAHWLRYSPDYACRARGEMAGLLTWLGTGDMGSQNSLPYSHFFPRKHPCREDGATNCFLFSFALWNSQLSMKSNKGEIHMEIPWAC